MDSTAYMPSGWTVDRLRAATVADLKEVPEDKLHLLEAERIEDPYAKNVVIFARLNEDDRTQRERLGLPPRPNKIGAAEPESDSQMQAQGEQHNGRNRGRNRDQFVQVVEDAGFDKFGIWLVRLDYSDEESWDAFGSRLIEVLDETVRETPGGAGMEDILEMPFIEDPELDGASWGDIVNYYWPCAEAGMVHPGQDTNVILAVDKESMKSLISPTGGQTAWVWAVDMLYSFWEQQDDEEIVARQLPGPGEYPGFFKVAVSSIVTDLYPMLVGLHLGGHELWQPNTEIWCGQQC